MMWSAVTSREFQFIYHALLVCTYSISGKLYQYSLSIVIACHDFDVEFCPFAGYDGLVGNSSLSAESHLKNTLLENYDTSVRPVYNASKQTNITLDLVLQQIIDVVLTLYLLKSWLICLYLLVREKTMCPSLMFAEWKVTNSHGHILVTGGM